MATTQKIKIPGSVDNPPRRNHRIFWEKSCLAVAAPKLLPI
jgi:hypothetical protein